MMKTIHLLLGVLAIARMAIEVDGACPNKCSGHGECGASDKCTCYQNWIGSDCSQRQCPFTRAWQDTPKNTDDAHYYAECGNRGRCDRETGICECDSGFTGSGCRRLGCPNDCSGHGTCEYIEDLASDSFDLRVGGDHAVTYGLWDQEKIMGCKCDPGFEGYDCSSRICPKGDDLLTAGESEMSQVIFLTLDGDVEGYVTYRDPYGNAWTTETMTFSDATATFCQDVLQPELRRLPNNVLNEVEVTNVLDWYKFSRDSPTSRTGQVEEANSVAYGGDLASDDIACLIDFKAEPGETGYQHFFEVNLQPHDKLGQHPRSVGTTTAANVWEVMEAYTIDLGGATPPLAGHSHPLRELAECSNRGICDSQTGVCQCFTGHMGLACERQEALV